MRREDRDKLEAIDQAIDYGQTKNALRMMVKMLEDFAERLNLIEDPEP